MKKIAILGSTGSIGRSTLDVISRHPDRFVVVALAGGGDVELLAEQIGRYKPSLVSVKDESSRDRLKALLKNSPSPELVFGIEGASAVAAHPEAETVLSAIVGAAGLVPTIAAIKAKKTVALANKETMVVAGELVEKLAVQQGVKILPVDSEHSAIYQSLCGYRREDLLRILLTASGGPFLRASKEVIEQAKPEQALKHPRWTMGAKITIDSATLMNKGLEIIEARWLFDVPLEKISVVVHPQSIIHSMVEYIDGCVVAQLGVPDMRAPIAYAISWPARVESGAPRLQVTKMGELTFEEPDLDRFPCLSLAIDALKVGRSMPAVLNAANEIAVAAFLAERIRMGSIARVIRETMENHDPKSFSTVEEILSVDAWARERAETLTKKLEMK